MVEEVKVEELVVVVDVEVEIIVLVGKREFLGGLGVF